MSVNVSEFDSTNSEYTFNKITRTLPLIMKQNVGNSHWKFNQAENVSDILMTPQAQAH